MPTAMKYFVLPVLALFLAACGPRSDADLPAEPGWVVDFFDDFDTFDEQNWQDQILWVNNEDQCYLPDGELNTREVSDGTLKLRVINVGEPRPCDNLTKFGKQHPDTPYVAGRIASRRSTHICVAFLPGVMKAAGQITAKLRYLVSEKCSH